MKRFDWNGNGKRDVFDDFMDMKVIEEVNRKTDDYDYDDYDYDDEYENYGGSVYSEPVTSDDSTISNEPSKYRQTSLASEILKPILVLLMCLV